MLAYNKKFLDAVEMNKEARLWHSSKFISAETLKNINEKHVSELYTPNIFIRIGLFIFTIISVSAGLSLITAFTGMDAGGMDAFGIRLIVYSVLIFFVLQEFINNRKTYRAGIDDALLYICIGCLISGILLLVMPKDMPGENEILLYFMIALPIIIFAAIRYADMLLSANAFICFMAIVFLLTQKLGDVSKFILPFLLMIVSGGIFFLIKKIAAENKNKYWSHCFIMIETLSLFTLYLSVNYLVVRELSIAMFDMQLGEGENIPFAFLFYLFTVSIPFVYIYYGLKIKDRTMLRVGLIILGLTVFTFKYYYSLGHHEITLTISGIIMIVIAWLSIRYLKTPRHGLTYEENKSEDFINGLDAEALVITQTFSQTHHHNQNSDMGGGNFGGGGANSSY